VAAADGDAEVSARLGALFLRMVRPRVVVTMWTFLLIGLARHAGPTLGMDLLAATLALAATYAVATSLNDVADADIDRMNGLGDRSRPLATGTATAGDLRRVAGAGAAIAGVAALPLGPAGVAAIGLLLAIAFCYSAAPARLSRRWTLAPVALTIAYVALPYWLGVTVAHGRWSAADVPLVLGLCVLFFGRIILKDVRDRLGDAAHGKQTLLLRLGKDATCAIAIAAAVAGLVTVVLALRPSPPAAAAIALDGAAIVWMLLRLRATTDPVLELVTIGTAAKAGNAALIAVIAWLLLAGQGAPGQATLLAVSITGVAAWNVLTLARHPERVRIAYKPPASA
jgi:4-hydroxybenzoate polyprenyltransferase